MPELNKEEDLLIADDGSVTLTTHRVIVIDGKIRNQLMLADFISCSVNKYVKGNYKLIIIILSILIILSSIGIASEKNKFAHSTTILEESIHKGNIHTFAIFTYIFALFLVASLFYFRAAKRVLVEVIGKQNSISFNTKNKKSAQKFVNRLMIEKEKRINENKI